MQSNAEAAYGEQFDLRNTETATVGRDGLTLRFDRVTSDERCPVGDRCQDEGDAVVQVTVRQPPEEAAALVLHTDTSRGAEAPYRRYRIRLVRLAPRPVGEQPVPLPQYVGTFVVTASAPESSKEK